MSYTGGYQCRASCDALTTFMPAVLSAYSNLLCFLGAPSLILILSIRQALFSGTKPGKDSRNKVQFHDMLCNCLYVFYVHNDQDQFLLLRNGPSNLILDCASSSLFGQSVAPSFFCTIPQFYNFRTISHWPLLTLFVCLFFGFFSLCFLVTNRFY